MNNWRYISWSLHPLLVVILLLSALTGYFIELMILFALVLVHEMGHIFMAQAVGWKVKAVKLLPFGGEVEIENAGGTHAKDELLVALAGPMQHIWMISAVLICSELGLMDREWSSYLIEANLWIFCFNLLPILPLDGGKIVQALISYSASYYSTILWMTRISILLSVALIIFSVYPWLLGGAIKLNELMIGLFLLFSNISFRRHLPFILYRFILLRLNYINKKSDSTAKSRPMVVSNNMTIYNVLKQFHREKLNVICIMNAEQNQMYMINERVLLQHCHDNFNVHRAVSEILR